jgi:hypothetical protein
MTSTTSTHSKRLSVYFICNCAFLVLMLAAGFMVRSGQASYMPHTTVDKQFVRNIIASGETEVAWNALKNTEYLRAEGFQGIVSMMDLMQIATLIMAVFFIVNGYFLFKLRSTPSPTSVPVMVRS